VSGGNCFPLVFDYEASHPVFDDFRNGTSVECDDGRAAGHCFNQNQAERLGPGDRRQQSGSNRFFEAALSLMGEWERLLPVQINLQPDFERIRRRAP
jgi:hypothetical protein